jgi:hypothetical protein
LRVVDAFIGTQVPIPSGAGETRPPYGFAERVVLAAGRHNDSDRSEWTASTVPSKRSASVSLPTMRRSVGRREVTSATLHP